MITQARRSRRSIRELRVAYVLLTIFLAGGVTVSVNAQCAPTPLCPAVSVDGPSGLPEKDKPWSFRASLTPDTGNSDLELKWTTTFGEIVSGQGTRELLIRVPHDHSFDMTVRLEVRDRRTGCTSSDSAAAHFDAPRPPRKRILNLSGTATRMTKEQLRLIDHEIKGDPTTKLLIELARIDERSFASVEKQLRSTLAKMVGKPDRLLFVRSEERMDRITFWLVPETATPPF